MDRNDGRNNGRNGSGAPRGGRSGGRTGGRTGQRRDDGAQRGSRPPQSERVPEPELPESLTAKDLDPGARAQLKTLSKENAEQVARHLAMVAQLIADDPQRAHEHAMAAERRAGRVAVVRETVAITAYAIGDFALAVRELRTYRRISGRNDQIALLVDSERGVGRPERAIEEGRAVDRSTLTAQSRAELAIALSGARLDLGQPELALAELEVPEANPDTAFPWSPDIFAARASVLEELGRDAEAARWRARAIVAEEALDAAGAASDVIEIETIEIDDDEDPA